MNFNSNYLQLRSAIVDKDTGWMVIYFKKNNSGELIWGKYPSCKWIAAV